MESVRATQGLVAVLEMQTPEPWLVLHCSHLHRHLRQSILRLAIPRTENQASRPHLNPEISENMGIWTRIKLVRQTHLCKKADL